MADDAQRWSEQVVWMLSPAMDDRLRTLAQKHGVSVGYAGRVAISLGLQHAERVDADTFGRAHWVLEQEARSRHDTCSGGWHAEDAA